MDIRVMKIINDTLSVEEGTWIDGKFRDVHDSRAYLRSLGFNSKEQVQYIHLGCTQVMYKRVLPRL